MVAESVVFENAVMIGERNSFPVVESIDDTHLSTVAFYSALCVPNRPNKNGPVNLLTHPDVVLLLP